MSIVEILNKAANLSQLVQAQNDIEKGGPGSGPQGGAGIKASPEDREKFNKDVKELTGKTDLFGGKTTEQEAKLHFAEKAFRDYKSAGDSNKDAHSKVQSMAGKEAARTAAYRVTGGKFNGD